MSEQYILSAKEVMSVILAMGTKDVTLKMLPENTKREMATSVFEKIGDAIRKEPMGENKGIDIIRLYKIIEKETLAVAKDKGLAIDKARLSSVISRQPSKEDRVKAAVQNKINEINPAAIDEAQPNTALSFALKIGRSYSELVKTIKDPDTNEKAAVYATARFVGDLVKNKFLNQVQEELRK